MKLQMSLRVLSGIVILALLFCSSLAIQHATFAHAANGEDVSPIIHYKGQIPEPTVSTLQGKLTSVTFALYDAEDEGKELWRETQDIPIASNGSFHALLGSVTPFSTIPGGIDALFPDSPRWLRVLTHMATNSPLLNR